METARRPPPGPYRFVVYRPEDYADFWQRLTICAIDTAVLLVSAALIALLTGVAISALGIPELLIPAALMAQIGMSVWYVAVLKLSGTRTLGYRLTGCQVVSVDGGRPSIRTMTTRFILWFIVSPPYNLLSIVHDETRQAISDMIAGTLVIRYGARPIGMVKRKWGYLFFMRDAYLISCPDSRGLAGQLEGVEASAISESGS